MVAELTLSVPMLGFKLPQALMFGHLIPTAVYHSLIVQYKQLLIQVLVVAILTGPILAILTMPMVQVKSLLEPMLAILDS